MELLWWTNWAQTTAKNGGWTSIKDTIGVPLFTNQGDCVSFVETDGRNNPGQNLP